MDKIKTFLKEHWKTIVIALMMLVDILLVCRISLYISQLNEDSLHVHNEFEKVEYEDEISTDYDVIEFTEK